MRHVLAAVVFVVACGKGGGKSGGGGSGSASDSTAAGPRPATPGKAEQTVRGTLAIAGAMTAAVSWKPDLALTCACLNEKEVDVDATYSDGADAFVAFHINTTNGLILTSGKLPTPAPLRQPGTAGFTASCKPDNRNTDGVMSIDVDAKLTGKTGEVTVKGHLDVVCRSGL